VREIFFEDLKKLHDKCGPWDLVLFTGDLTQRGSAEEFQKVDELLQQLWEYFQQLGSSPILLAVPGNHDLVRPAQKTAAVRTLIKWEQNADIHDEFWENDTSEYRQVVTQAFVPYTKFKRVYDDEVPEEVLTAALEQIEERQYVAELEAAGIHDILKLAIAFQGKQLWVRRGGEE
jgi:predicted MPP superfamily phosphohydrolase